MSKQPEALRLADVLDAGVNFYAESSLWFDNDLCRATDLAAAKLRRQHSVNADLLEALQAVMRWLPVYPQSAECIVGAHAAYDAAVLSARAAIANAKAEEA